MKFSKTASVEELQVISRFESLRKILLSEQYADHLKKPLAYWALPTDRRLPAGLPGTHAWRICLTRRSPSCPTRRASGKRRSARL